MRISVNATDVVLQFDEPNLQDITLPSVPGHIFSLWSPLDRCMKIPEADVPSLDGVSASEALELFIQEGRIWSPLAASDLPELAMNTAIALGALADGPSTPVELTPLNRVVLSAMPVTNLAYHLACLSAGTTDLTHCALEELSPLKRSIARLCSWLVPRTANIEQAILSISPRFETLVVLTCAIGLSASVAAFAFNAVPFPSLAGRCFGSLLVLSLAGLTFTRYFHAVRSSCWKSIQSQLAENDDAALEAGVERYLRKLNTAQFIERG